MTNEDTNNIGNRERHHRPQKNMILIIRNALNIIFMLTAIVGIIIYMSSDKETGMYIMLAAIPFKITESAIRLLRI
ncbi:hypothetical protein [Prevotella sp. MGM1]|uniref:hypothetical protein n=1 Tax=Prevotella sp. MGM1 TaxID=2033405 RepID=UPI000CEA0F15|nr:hypothetical protein [Prevotella sp. MGM1]